MPTRLLLLLLGAALAAGCGDASSGPPAAPGPAAHAPPVVKTVHPEYKTRATAIETSGKAQFNEEQLARVQAPLTGRVVEVLARPGDLVESGQRLFVLDSPDLGQAKSDYAKAAADVERAQKALDLARELFEARAIAQKEIRETENDWRKAIAERERAASRLRTLGVPPAQLEAVAARADASTRIVVTAPRSGIIVERNVAPGQVVAYGQSDTPLNLFVIADLSTMWVVADVYEPDVPKVRLGQAVTVTLPCCPGDRYEGRVSYISDTVDKETRTVKVRAVVPNRGRALKAEMFVKVAIGTGTSRVLAIPESAVHTEERKTFVLVQTGRDAYTRRPVRLGATFDGLAEVIEGVGPDDLVVTSGGILLKKSGK
ncbi:MAG TPA: efflux RND transporter periplasmic adaptor subunit [Methylomirabilota bacterium]|nr:efflux RND transporter periplasmic adaptor subunit [Methylomirabilota bacterium]